MGNFPFKKKPEIDIEKKLVAGEGTPKSGVYPLKRSAEAVNTPKMPVNEDTVREWARVLSRYKAGKANLEKRIISNEQWYKMRHWEEMRRYSRERGGAGDPDPSSGWLMNCIASKHADAMDAYPEAICLPREEGDRGEAKMLSSILPVVMAQNDFEETYDRAWWYKLISGTGVYGIFWDSGKHNGLGDISIKKLDLLNLFWEPGINDIQKSKYVFYTELIDNDTLLATYPKLMEKNLNAGTFTVSKYQYDDNVSTEGKSLVVDVYYKKKVAGRDVLHYAKFVGETILLATENETAPETEAGTIPEIDPETGERVMRSYEKLKRPPMGVVGAYDHGKYPFVLDVLFPEEGTPAGFGYVDICKEPQKFIDLLDNAIMKNALAGATPRFFSAMDGNINEEEFNDWTNPIVHCSGRIGDESIRQINVNPVSGIYVQIQNNKINELKETSGNRDVNNGGSSGGVTAASAIAALQEQGGKLSRDMIKSAYRAYREIAYFCVELIRQFYDLPRQFRIMGSLGSEEFISYTNEHLKPQWQGEYFGVNMGYRLPEFDIEIEAQKESPYRKMEYNELALQFYKLGFFEAGRTDQALIALDMMDFKAKDRVMAKVAENGTIHQELATWQKMALSLAERVDPELAEGLAEQIEAEYGGGVKVSAGAGRAPSQSVTEKAKTRAREAVTPR